LARARLWLRCAYGHLVYVMNTCERPPDAGHNGPCAAAPINPAATPAEVLGKRQWTLKALTADIKQLRFSFSSAEQNQNVRLAVNHLEDALHRLSLAIDQVF